MEKWEGSSKLPAIQRTAKPHMKLQISAGCMNMLCLEEGQPPVGLPKWQAGKISSLGEWLIIGKSSPGKWWCYHLWKCSKHEQKWQLGMWFSGHGDIQSRVGLDDSLILFYNKRQGTSVCSSTSSSVTLLTGRGQKSQHFGYKGHIHLKGNT